MTQNQTRRDKKRHFKFLQKYFQKPLDKHTSFCYNNKVAAPRCLDAAIAQSVEHVIGNDEVISSILITSSKAPRTQVLGAFSLQKKRRADGKSVGSRFLSVLIRW